VKLCQHIKRCRDPKKEGESIDNTSESSSEDEEEDLKYEKYGNDNYGCGND